MVAFFFPPGLNKPIPSVSFTSEEEYSGFSSSPSFTNAPVGTASIDRLVVVALSWYVSGSSRTLSSATIGGIAATIVDSESDGNESGVAIISAVVPTGTTATVAMSFSGTVTRVSGGVYAVYNLKSTTATDADSTTGSGGFGSTTKSVTIDTLQDGIVIASGYIEASDGTTTITFSAGVTEDYENVSGDFRANGGNALAASTSMTVTMSGTNDDIFDNWTVGVCAASWR